MNFIKKAELNKIITLVFFSLLLFYFINNKEALTELLSIPFWIVAFLILLKAARIMVTGLFTLFTLQAFNANINVKESNYLSLISSIGNFFGPILGGASIRALYLKKKYNFEYSKFISTLYGFYIITFLTNALIGLALLGFFYSKYGTAQGFEIVLLVLLAVFLGCTILVTLPIKLLRATLKKMNFLPNRLHSAFTSMLEGWQIIRSNKRLLFKLFILNLMIFFIAALESYLVFIPFVTNFSLLSVLLYTLLGTFSILVSFTPGAMGIREAIYLFTTGILFISSSQILQMATVDRGTSFLLLFLTYGMVKIFKLDKKIISNNGGKTI